MTIRIRTMAAIGGVALLVGGAAWFFAAGTSSHGVGAGGLPLIKASTNPVKLPPEDPGGEILANADSTVFYVMGDASGIDPSLTNVKPPEPPAAPEAEPAPQTVQMAEFAGLRTGFAIPAEPEKKTETLFSAAEAEPKTEAVVEVQEGETIAEPAPIPPESALPEAADAAIPSEPIVRPIVPPVVKDAPALPGATIAANTAANTAQALEAQEKQTLQPAPAPEAVPDVVPESAPEPAAKPVAKPRAEQPRAPEKAAANLAREKLEDVIKAASADAPAPPPAARTADADAAYVPPQRAASPAPASGARNHYIQLASTPQGTDAQAVWGRLQRSYAGALAGLTPIYQTADVPGKGTYIRIQAGPMTQDEANDRCARLRAIDPKGGCLVLRR